MISLKPSAPLTRKEETDINRQFIDALRDMMGLDSLEKPRKSARTTPVRKYVRHVPLAPRAGKAPVAP